MQMLVMIPALCCDEGLYEGIAGALADIVSPRIITPYEATLEACADRVLSQVEGDFIVMGTSFGGHVARETALAAPKRVKGLWVIGAGPGAVADPKSGYTYGAFPKPWVKISKPYDCPSPRIVDTLVVDSLLEIPFDTLQTEPTPAPTIAP